MLIEIISDVICPWCFIGKRHLEAALKLLAEDGLHFTTGWRPYQLNPEMPPEGISRQMYRTAKFGSLARSQELDANVAESGRVVGLEFRFDRMEVTPNTIEAHRAVRIAGSVGLEDAMVERLFAAYFTEGCNVGDVAVLARLAGEIGMDPKLLLGVSGRSDVIASDSAARAAGLNGVPSFLMQGYLLFSGAMPAEQMAAQFRRAHSILQARAA